MDMEMRDADTREGVRADGGGGHDRVAIHPVQTRMIRHGNASAGIMVRIVVAAASAAFRERIVLMAQSAVAGRRHSLLIGRHVGSADGSDADKQGFHHFHRVKRRVDHLLFAKKKLDLEYNHQRN